MCGDLEVYKRSYHQLAEREIFRSLRSPGSKIQPTSKTKLFYFTVPDDSGLQPEISDAIKRLRWEPPENHSLALLSSKSEIGDSPAFFVHPWPLEKLIWDPERASEPRDVLLGVYELSHDAPTLDAA